ncbi:MAG: CTP synthase [Bdellovibrionales bacterium]|jgi:CTP synthase|nr:CTP synthase [Bdellovibrionales bacterium]
MPRAVKKKNKLSHRQMLRKTTVRSAKKLEQKFIFVTGGVVSSIGKGLTAASLGTLLEARGSKVTIMKFDPYLNVDPGTMSPLQHGEVFVTEDGAETDLDLGHYERFTSITVQRANSVSTGQVYEAVIAKERRGDYLGGTVQVIPHITDEIKARMFEAAQGAEVAIVEIGGTVGDIESLPFLEAIRQMRTDLGHENSLFIHVTYVPYIAAAGELKSKPTQHSVKELREIGIQPDFLICRSEKDIPKEVKAKIGLFCSVRPDNVIAATDCATIYEVPLMLHEQGFDELVVERLGIEVEEPDIAPWREIVGTLKNPGRSVRIGVVGKYVDLKESYKSLHEAIVHGGIANNTKVDLSWIDSESLTADNVEQALKDVDGILVPGGFGERGAEGKMLAIQHARVNLIPFFGICFGMQLAAIEFARNVCGISDATSREFKQAGKKKSRNFVIDIMEEQRTVQDKGGTMRLGSYPCSLEEGTLVRRIYGKSLIHERHRHRYEYNNRYRPLFEKNGMTLSGVCEERDLVEIIELGTHPWFIGVQFHPEFKSRPTSPHPLFRSFVEASLNHVKQAKATKQAVKPKVKAPAAKKLPPARKPERKATKASSRTRAQV